MSEFIESQKLINADFDLLKEVIIANPPVYRSCFEMHVAAKAAEAASVEAEIDALRAETPARSNPKKRSADSVAAGVAKRKANAEEKRVTAIQEFARKQKEYERVETEKARKYAEYLEKSGQLGKYLQNITANELKWTVTCVDCMRMYVYMLSDGTKKEGGCPYCERYGKPDSDSESDSDETVELK